MQETEVKTKIVSNVVKKECLRDIQKKTLQVLSNILAHSFGVMGSNSIIMKDNNPFPIYSKDGYTILQNVAFQNGTIENTVKTDVEEIVRHIVKKVGDGTTSAVILSNYVFQMLCDIEEKYSKATPNQIVNVFKQVVDDIVKQIKSQANEIKSHEDIYKIAHVSTNGNDELANAISQIYKDYGNEVYIDVLTGIDTNNYIKEYNGLTLESGYGESCFINNKSKAVASIRHPRIYAFADPIDTPEMASFVEKIVKHNIFDRYEAKKEMIPTVILSKFISRDLTNTMNALINSLYNMREEVRPPFLLVNKITEEEKYHDLIKLCGCKPIYKYINFKTQEEDVKKGIAPSLETITEFYGTCDLVEADINKTKIVNPALMLNKEGEYSDTFKNLLDVLESELDNAKKDNRNSAEIFRLKRRITSLTSNLVEFYVGGISVGDREADKALVEDAVLNCRSAVEHGYGKGANFEGLMASKIISEKSSGNIYSDIADGIYKSYLKVIDTLYATVITDESDREGLINKSISEEMPLNLRTLQFDGVIISSIESDIEILKGIAKILTLMSTSNQFITKQQSIMPYIMDTEQL